MAYRKEGFETEGVYHLLNRGVDKRETFADDADRVRFLQLLTFYRQPKPLSFTETTRLERMRGRPSLLTRNEAVPRAVIRPTLGPPLLEFLCYCLMPNHFHLLVRQLADVGIPRFMQRALNSYTRYFNERHRRSGPLFAGQYRAVRVETDEQLLHVSRYIHLNPYVAGLTWDPLDAPWSSLPLYLPAPAAASPSVGLGVRAVPSHEVPVYTDLLQQMMPPETMVSFLCDHAGYARELARIKNLVLDDEVEVVRLPRPSYELPK